MGLLAHARKLGIESISVDLIYGLPLQTVESFERQYLSQALRENEGNVSRTATAIGMVRQSLQQKIRELGLKVDEFRRRARD